MEHTRSQRNIHGFVVINNVITENEKLEDINKIDDNKNIKSLNIGLIKTHKKCHH